MAELDGGFGVHRKENFFDGDDFGLMAFEERDQLRVNEGKACGEQRFFRGADAAGAEGDEVWIAGGIVPLHNTVAGRFGSAVDAADSHMQDLSRRSGSPEFLRVSVSQREKGSLGKEI
jgi:hypothetical protein